MVQRSFGIVTQQRTLEPGLARDLRNDMSYERYLRLDQLLSAQQPLSSPEHPDELLFIIQHQTSELWFKLAIHELRLAIGHLAADEGEAAMKRLGRFGRIQQQLTSAWGVLESLTPTEYAGYRAVLGSGSGFQSAQYRVMEFLLGNKDPRLAAFFAHSPAGREALRSALHTPSLYDEFLRFLARQGHPVPRGCLDRDWATPRQPEPALLPTLRAIYENPGGFEYRLCEQLVDIEEHFQLWRFRHLKAVERVIGNKPGTAGSTGIAFLKSALDQPFFPELLDIRGEIG